MLGHRRGRDLSSLHPIDCSPPDFSVHGFSRQEHWSGLPCPPPGNLPDPGIKPGSPTLQADSLESEPPTYSEVQASLFSLCVSVVTILRQGRVLREELSAQADPVLTWSSACLVAWSKLLHLSEPHFHRRVRQVDGIGSYINPPRLSASFHNMNSGYSEIKFKISVIIGIYAFKQ